MSAEDLDFLDLFGDGRRSKIFIELTEDETSIGMTFASASDCLRLHPTLMGPGWDFSHASRDAQQIWDSAASDVTRFLQLLNIDGLLLGGFSWI